MAPLFFGVNGITLVLGEVTHTTMKTNSSVLQQISGLRWTFEGPCGGCVHLLIRKLMGSLE